MVGIDIPFPCCHPAVSRPLAPGFKPLALQDISPSERCLVTHAEQHRDLVVRCASVKRDGDPVVLVHGIGGKNHRFVRPMQVPPFPSSFILWGYEKATPSEVAFRGARVRCARVRQRYAPCACRSGDRFTSPFRRRRCRPVRSDDPYDRCSQPRACRPRPWTRRRRPHRRWCDGRPATGSARL